MLTSDERTVKLASCTLHNVAQHQGANKSVQGPAALFAVQGIEAICRMLRLVGESSVENEKKFSEFEFKIDFRLVSSRMLLLWLSSAHISL